MKSGYLYVLTHPSYPNLYKIGVTVLHPERRLKQHNASFNEYAGKVVRCTGQHWHLKTYVEVVDPYWAEKVFWNETPFPLLPGGVSVEIYEMNWEMVQRGLDAAKTAGIRPERKKSASTRNREWLERKLEGSGISIVGRYAGLIKKTEFQCVHGHSFLMSPGRLVFEPACPLCDPC